MKAVSDTPWRKHAAAGGGDFHNRLLQPVQEDREVVRREVAHHAVAVVLAEVHPRGGDEVHVPDDAATDQIAHRVDGGAVDEGVPGHQYAVGRGGEIGELERVPQAGGKRLLHQHVLAGPQRAGGERRVRLRRRGDHHRLDLGVHQQRVEVAHRAGAGVATAEEVQLGGVGVAQRIEAQLRAFRHVACEVGAPVAVPDHRGADRLLARQDVRGGAQLRVVLRPPPEEPLDSETSTPPPAGRARPAPS